MTSAFDKTVSPVRYRIVKYFRGKLVIVFLKMMDAERLGVPVLLFKKIKLAIN